MTETNRRTLFTTALAGAAAAAVGATAATVAHAATAHDPIIDMIAEEDRLRNIAIKYSDRADLIVFALPEEERCRVLARDDTERHEPASAARLYAKARPYYDAAGELFDRIEGTIPQTIAGAIALIEFAAVDDNPAVESAITGLRQIAAKGGVA